MEILLLNLNMTIRIATLKLHIIFHEQKAHSMYSGDNKCYQFNPKTEIENERESYRGNNQVG